MSICKLTLNVQRIGQILIEFYLEGFTLTALGIQTSYGTCLRFSWVFNSCPHSCFECLACEQYYFSVTGHLM